MDSDGGTERTGRPVELEHSDEDYGCTESFSTADGGALNKRSSDADLIRPAVAASKRNNGERALSLSEAFKQYGKNKFTVRQLEDRHVKAGSGFMSTLLDTPTESDPGVNERDSENDVLEYQNSDEDDQLHEHDDEEEYDNDFYYEDGSVGNDVGYEEAYSEISPKEPTSKKADDAEHWDLRGGTVLGGLSSSHSLRTKPYVTKRTSRDREGPTRTERYTRVESSPEYAGDDTGRMDSNMSADDRLKRMYPGHVPLDSTLQLLKDIRSHVLHMKEPLLEMGSSESSKRSGNTARGRGTPAAMMRKAAQQRNVKQVSGVKGPPARVPDWDVQLARKMEMPVGLTKATLKSQPRQETRRQYYDMRRPDAAPTSSPPQGRFYSIERYESVDQHSLGSENSGLKAPSPVIPQKRLGPEFSTPHGVPRFVDPRNQAIPPPRRPSIVDTSGAPVGRAPPIFVQGPPARPLLPQNMRPVKQFSAGRGSGVVHTGSEQMPTRVLPSRPADVKGTRSNIFGGGAVLEGVTAAAAGGCNTVGPPVVRARIPAHTDAQRASVPRPKQHYSSLQPQPPPPPFVPSVAGSVQGRQPVASGIPVAKSVVFSGRNPATPSALPVGRSFVRAGLMQSKQMPLRQPPPLIGPRGPTRHPAQLRPASDRAVVDNGPISVYNDAAPLRRSEYRGAATPSTMMSYVRPPTGVMQRPYFQPPPTIRSNRPWA